MRLTGLKSLFKADRLRDTVLRFPLSSLCSLICFFIAVLTVHEVIKADEILAKWLAIFACGYFVFGIAKLMSESGTIKSALQYLIGFVVSGLLAALIFLSPVWHAHLQFVIPALLLLICVAPFIKSGDDISVWSFNYTTWFGVGMSIAAALILGAGLSAALASINYLFKAHINDNVYGDIWAFSSCIVAPLYALSWVPTRFVFTADECRAPVQLNFIINWLLAPLVWLYMLILYAYLVKIVGLQEIPRGQLSYMISGFGGVGVVTYLFGWPLREDGSWLLRVFYRFFFPALLLPIGMLFFAISERIHAYGITEQRYMIAMAAVWFAVIAVLFTIKKFPLKIIPGILAVLFALASFGPWGGVSLSSSSQFHRLERLLVKNEILQNGKIGKAPKEVPFEDRQNIASILDYLHYNGREKKLQALLGQSGALPSTYDLTKQMGFEYVSSYQQPREDGRFNLYAQRQNQGLTDIRGYDYLLPNNYLYANAGSPVMKKTIEAEGSNPKITFSITPTTLEIIEGENTEPLKIDLAGYFAKTVSSLHGTTPNQIVIAGENAAMRAVVNVQSVGGRLNNGKAEIQNIQFDLLLDLKDR